MNPKLLAIKRTLLVLSIMIMVPVVLSLLFFLSSEVLGWIFISVLIASFIWMIYSINLSNINHEIAIQQSIDRIQAITDSKKV
jgi:4-hydroxybenzoate polyprenyltransferase